jgi:hypothetical protein
MTDLSCSEDEECDRSKRGFNSKVHRCNVLVFIEERIREDICGRRKCIKRADKRRIRIPQQWGVGEEDDMSDE